MFSSFYLKQRLFKLWIKESILEDKKNVFNLYYLLYNTACLQQTRKEQGKNPVKCILFIFDHHLKQHLFFRYWNAITNINILKYILYNVYIEIYIQKILYLYCDIQFNEFDICVNTPVTTTLTNRQQFCHAESS